MLNKELRLLVIKGTKLAQGLTSAEFDRKYNKAVVEAQKQIFADWKKEVWHKTLRGNMSGIYELTRKWCGLSEKEE